MKILYIFTEIIATIFLSFCLFDMLIDKAWKNSRINETIKHTTKNKKMRYIVCFIFILNFVGGKITDIREVINPKDYEYEYSNDLMKRNYEIIKGGDGKLYCVMNKAESVPKAIIAEVKSYNEIILDKPKNIFAPYKGKDITIDFSNIKMIDREYEFHSVQNFDEVTFENQKFGKIKGKDEVYIYPYIYKIVKETDKNITVKFKGRKKVKFEEIVPMVNNEIIPSNYLEFYKEEKTLTVLFN